MLNSWGVQAIKGSKITEIMQQEEENATTVPITKEKDDAFDPSDVLSKFQGDKNQ
jgi:hypothetical protein